MVEESEEVVEEVVEEKSEVEKVRADLDSITKANDEVEAQLLRKEELRARMALGGQSEAGQAPVKPTAQTDEEIAEKFDKGEVDILK